MLFWKHAKGCFEMSALSVIIPTMYMYSEIVQGWVPSQLDWILIDVGVNTLYCKLTHCVMLLAFRQFIIKLECCECRWWRLLWLWETL